MDFAHGAIRWLSADAVATVYTVSGLSFQPKAIRFYWCGLDSAGTDVASQTTTMRRGVGFAVSTSSRRSVASFSADAAAAADTDVCLSDDCVVSTTSGAGARDGLLDLNSITSDGFTLIVDDQGVANITVFWEAWGGADITVATVGDIAEPAATGNQDYTVTGFAPGADQGDQVVMFAGCQSTAAVNTAQVNDSGLCIGFASATNTAGGVANVVVAGNSDEASLTMDTDGYGLSGECLAMFTVAGGNPNARAQLTQFNSNGFRLNWIARGVTNRRYCFMAIKGGAWRAGSYTIAGNSLSATATVSALPFTPKGISLVGRMTTESSAGTSTAQDRIGLGSGSSTSSRRSMGIWDEDATANTEIDLVIEYDSVLCYPSNAGALVASYDINAMNSDGFQIIVDLAGGVASEWQGYLAFGDKVTGSLPDIVMPAMLPPMRAAA